MTNRSFKVEPWLWAAALKRANERGESLGHAIRQFLRRYVR